MKLIVGLGNPGKEYENTRHNVGFLILDKMQNANIKSQNDNVKFKMEKKLNAEIVKINIDDEEILLTKPQTFMNLSGEAVQKIVQFYKIKPEDIIVVCDDINLEIGQVRIRKGGSDGGHNGLKSIIAHLGSDFWRIRVGVGKNTIPAEAYVLQKFPIDEQEAILKTIDKTADLLVELISSGLKEETIFINNK